MNRGFFLYVLLLLLILQGCAATKNYEKAKVDQSIAAYTNYIETYPKSKFIEIAKSELAVLVEKDQWETARMIHSVSKYESYLSKYPSGSFSNQAKQNIATIKENTAWSKTKRLNSVFAFENFIETYPNSEFNFEARNTIQQLKDNNAWNAAIQKNSIGGYRLYLSEYNDGMRKADALVRINEISTILPVWVKAGKSNNPQTIRMFIATYPNSIYAEEAQLKLNELEESFWNKATSSNTVSSYQNYIKKFPDGNYASFAEKAIIDIEVNDIFNSDHGSLPPMSKNTSSSEAEEINKIDLFNNTPYTLTVRYSGTVESKKVILKSKAKLNFELLLGKKL
jgi:outer membrane protein assembly factor BamD (BamD/ComL family)